MKSSLLLAFLIGLWIGLPNQAKAQAFYPGQLTFSPAIGIRTASATAVAAQTGISSAPFFMYVDYGVEDFLSLGPWLGYRYYNCQNCVLEAGGLFSAGVRFNVHVLPAIERIADQEVNIPKLDPYVSLMGGYEWRANNWRVPRAALGLRFYANPRVAFFGELGTGVFNNLLAAGCTFRMN